MSYKAKSLAYFVCFLIAAIAYHGTNNKGLAIDQNNDSLVKIEADQTKAPEAFQAFKVK